MIHGGSTHANEVADSGTRLWQILHKREVLAALSPILTAVRATQPYASHFSAMEDARAAAERLQHAVDDSTWV